MDKAEFAVEVRTGSLTSSGMDPIEFLFSANEGEPVRPLGRIASGGELSRIMLALKETLAEVDMVPVLIFDEVDAGIGGRTAEHVGMRLKSLATKHQVLCITHLPQIAAMADRHMMIEELSKKDGLWVSVRETSREEREEEIARMLSGKITDISLRHARELLGRR
jgi:DNA repair protein RecN (Recombination protein N)